MRRVWKVEVPVDGEAHPFDLPAGALIGCLVACQTTPDLVQVWAEVDDFEPPIRRWLRVYGTDHEIDPHAGFVGSTITAGGALVWHVFEVGGEGEA